MRLADRVNRVPRHVGFLMDGTTRATITGTDKVDAPRVGRWGGQICGHCIACMVVVLPAHDGLVGGGPWLQAGCFQSILAPFGEKKVTVSFFSSFRTCASEERRDRCRIR